MDVCIVNFNTPELVRAAIISLWRHTPGCNVTVFDNSDSMPPFSMEGVHTIDNTKGQIIDFDEFLSRYPNKVSTFNNWGSAKHCYTIQKLWDYFPDGFVLMDSDVLVKRDISEFFDNNVAWVGTVYSNPESAGTRTPRLLPFLCWINVPMCRKYDINYFDGTRNWKLYKYGNRWYDTGASFYEDCQKAGLPTKPLDIDNYIIHFGNAHKRGKNAWMNWLEEHKELYTMEKKIEKKTEKKTKSVQNLKDKYLVVIPFFAGGAQGREIEYAVAGWRRHFKEPYQIVLVGDYHPVVDAGDDITFIECERVPEQPEYNYRPHIDFVKKFKAVRKAFPNSKGFIFVADDCYAVNDFDIYDVMLLKQNGDYIKVNGESQIPWEKEKYKTVCLLKKEGYPYRNFTTHIPQWIEWDKLEALWEKYDMEHNSYIFEDLYFNIYYPNRVPLQLNIDFDNFKCGVYRPNPRIPYIERAFRHKIWIQNSVEGWIPILDQMLAEYYGL